VTDLCPFVAHRYVLSVSVGDHTGQCWLSGFNDVGHLIIGLEAGQMEHLKEEDEPRFRQTLSDATARMWAFSCRAKSDTYQDQVKVKYQILAAKPVDFVEAGKALVEDIQKYIGTQ
jgi:replication factor A1